MLIDYKF